MNTFIRTKQHKERKKRTAQKNSNIQPSLHNDGPTEWLENFKTDCLIL